MLQGFNGTLTMLDGRAGGAGLQEGGQSDYGGDSGFGGYGESRRGGSKPSSSFDKPLDDEIPF